MLFSYISYAEASYENKMHAKIKKQVRDSAAPSDCKKISCIRKVGKPRIRKLSAYEIFWIYSTCMRARDHDHRIKNDTHAHVHDASELKIGLPRLRGKSATSSRSSACQQISSVGSSAKKQKPWQKMLRESVQRAQRLALHVSATDHHGVDLCFECSAEPGGGE